MSSFKLKWNPPLNSLLFGQPSGAGSESNQPSAGRPSTPMAVGRATQRFFFYPFVVPSALPNVTWFPEFSLLPTCLLKTDPNFSWHFPNSTENWWQNSRSSLPVGIAAGAHLASCPPHRGTSDQLQAMIRCCAPGPCFTSTYQPRLQLQTELPRSGGLYISCTLGAKCRCPSAPTPTSSSWRPMPASVLRPVSVQGSSLNSDLLTWLHMGDPWGAWKSTGCAAQCSWCCQRFLKTWTGIASRYATF